ncbi:MAG: hypothetical protein ACI4WW_02065 [Candidatus Coprovivens sp.]
MAEFNVEDLGVVECKKCGYSNINGVKYCAKCKNRLVEYGNNVCPRCGVRYSDKKKKCENCGFNVKYKRIHRFMSTLLQLMFVGCVGFFLIKYGDNYNVWVVRMIIVLSFLGIYVINKKEYNKPIEYQVDEDPIIEMTAIEKKKTKNVKNKAKKRK